MIEFVSKIESIDVVYFVLKILLGLLIGMIYKDVIKRKLYIVIILMSKIFGNGSKIKGTWKAVFSYVKMDSNTGDTTCASGEIIQYTEIIKLYSAFGIIVGEIIPNALNTRKEDKKTLRIIGKRINNGHLTGTWYHPEENAEYYGSFQLDILPNNKEMHGQWIGFNTKREVKCNEWIWEKCEEDK